MSACPYWGLPEHGYDPRGELEWGYGSVMGDRDINEHCFDLLRAFPTHYKRRNIPLPPARDVVKVVTDTRGYALYFSRAPIPWPRGGELNPGTPWPETLHAWKHIGIYGYRRTPLLDLAEVPRSELEVTESLEQLRVLDRGWSMRILEWDYKGIGVDTAADLDRLRKYLSK